jgi:cell division protein FtsL
MHARESNSIVVFQAYEICIKRDLMREQVFILGRMGNAKKALAVIINKLGDIEEVFYLLFLQLFLALTNIQILNQNFRDFKVNFEVFIFLHRL